MAKMINCKHCGQEIAASAKVCPHCGGKNKKPFYKKWWFWVLVVLVLLIGAGSNGSKNTDTKKVGELETADKKEESKSAGTETASTEAKETEAKEAKTEYHVGDILEDGNMRIVYVSSGDYHEDNEYMQPQDGKKYIYAKFEFENISDSKDASVSFYSFECYADGYACDMHYGNDESLSATLSAGRTTSGILVFEVPIDAKEIEIEYTTNMFTSDKIKFIYDGEKDSGYTPKTNTAASADAYSVGSIVESSKMNVTYISCEKDTSYSQFSEPKSGYHYITCTFEFENVGDSDQGVTYYDFDCYADGVNCEQAYWRDDGISATLSAGRKTKGTVTYMVPDNATTVEVEYVANFWTSNRVVFTVEE
ncbi:DUF4352 domain-containing protein [Butyrivibrio sp. WCD3002]|uniref:DUF4352 domain-containing protein n=1 Tax=Butyrivibrio sp. WCD3002 TaxID=1280676 RepID=UPI0004005DA7|nr:DUF4352 domain-containing protein [Butyrivibrio sp. WCD3002]